MSHRPLPDTFPHGVHSSSFRPVWWLRNAHAQTLYSALFRKPPALHRQREKQALPDGDWVYLDWLLPHGWDQPERPLVIVVHGLSGSSDSHYVLGLQARLEAAGTGSVAMNCRGASGGPNHLPRSYHAGASDDIHAVIEALAARYPGRPLIVVGYSLGGNMTLKLLAELGDDPRVIGGVAVSVPLVLKLCSSHLDRGFSRLYRKHMMDELLVSWRAKREHFGRTGREEAAAEIERRLAAGPFTSFWQFDDMLMAPLHGFADVHDYYERCSSRQFLKDIRTPTLVIHAEDDPFMTAGVIPAASELSPWVHFELSQRGGHVGFIDGGNPSAPAYYLERRIPAFIAELGRPAAQA
jgi:predicted alpha/beta-fold hydrolase